MIMHVHIDCLDLLQPPPRIEPSTSNSPVPQPVNERIITVGEQNTSSQPNESANDTFLHFHGSPEIAGNDVIYRRYLDYPEKLQIVFPGVAFGSKGNITRWQVYTGRDCVLTAQVCCHTR
jgi:hypothetical protein